MYALTTLVDLDRYSTFAEVWQRLQEKCGLVTVNEVSFVHLSWQGAVDYQLEPAHIHLHEIASQTPAFPIRVAGLGIFTGKEPVLYLHVVADQTLLSLHRQLWDKLSPYADEPNAYYAPGLWVPHITLAYGVLLPNDLSCAVTQLMYEPFSAELEIDNLAFIYLRDGSVGIDSRFDLVPR